MADVTTGCHAAGNHTADASVGLGPERCGRSSRDNGSRKLGFCRFACRIQEVVVRFCTAVGAAVFGGRDDLAYHAWREPRVQMLAAIGTCVDVCADTAVIFSFLVTAANHGSSDHPVAVLAAATLIRTLYLSCSALHFSAPTQWQRFKGPMAVICSIIALMAVAYLSSIRHAHVTLLIAGGVSPTPLGIAWVISRLWLHLFFQLLPSPWLCIDAVLCTSLTSLVLQHTALFPPAATFNSPSSFWSVGIIPHALSWYTLPPVLTAIFTEAFLRYCFLTNRARAGETVVLGDAATCSSDANCWQQLGVQQTIRSKVITSRPGGSCDSSWADDDSKMLLSPSDSHRHPHPATLLTHSPSRHPMTMHTGTHPADSDTLFQHGGTEHAASGDRKHPPTGADSDTSQDCSLSTAVKPAPPHNMWLAAFTSSWLNKRQDGQEWADWGVHRCQWMHNIYLAMESVHHLTIMWRLVPPIVASETQPTTRSALLIGFAIRLVMLGSSVLQYLVSSRKASTHLASLRGHIAAYSSMLSLSLLVTMDMVGAGMCEAMRQNVMAQVLQRPREIVGVYLLFRIVILQLPCPWLTIDAAATLCVGAIAVGCTYPTWFDGSDCDSALCLPGWVQLLCTCTSAVLIVVWIDTAHRVHVMRARQRDVVRAGLVSALANEEREGSSSSAGQKAAEGHLRQPTRPGHGTTATQCSTISGTISGVEAESDSASRHRLLSGPAAHALSAGVDESADSQRSGPSTNAVSAGVGESAHSQRSEPAAHALSVEVAESTLSQRSGLSANAPSHPQAASQRQTPSQSPTPSQRQTPSQHQTPSHPQTPAHPQTPSRLQTTSHSQTPTQRQTPSHSQTPAHPQTPSQPPTPSQPQTPSHSQTARLPRTPPPIHTPAHPHSLPRLPAFAQLPAGVRSPYLHHAAWPSAGTLLPSLTPPVGGVLYRSPLQHTVVSGKIISDMDVTQVKAMVQQTLQARAASQGRELHITTEVWFPGCWRFLIRYVTQPSLQLLTQSSQTSFESQQPESQQLEFQQHHSQQRDGLQALSTLQADMVSQQQQSDLQALSSSQGDTLSQQENPGLQALSNSQEDMLSQQGKSGPQALSPSQEDMLSQGANFDLHALSTLQADMQSQLKQALGEQATITNVNIFSSTNPPRIVVPQPVAVVSPYRQSPDAQVPPRWCLQNLVLRLPPLDLSRYTGLRVVLSSPSSNTPIHTQAWATPQLQGLPADEGHGCKLLLNGLATAGLHTMESLEDVSHVVVSVLGQLPDAPVILGGTSHALDELIAAVPVLLMPSGEACTEINALFKRMVAEVQGDFRTAHSMYFTPFVWDFAAVLNPTAFDPANSGPVRQYNTVILQHLLQFLQQHDLTLSFQVLLEHLQRNLTTLELTLPPEPTSSPRSITSAGKEDSDEMKDAEIISSFKDIHVIAADATTYPVAVDSATLPAESDSLMSELPAEQTALLLQNNTAAVKSSALVHMVTSWNTRMTVGAPGMLSAAALNMRGRWPSVPVEGTGVRLRTKKGRSLGGCWVHPDSPLHLQRRPVLMRCAVRAASIVYGCWLAIHCVAAVVWAGMRPVPTRAAEDGGGYTLRGWWLPFSLISIIGTGVGLMACLRLVELVFKFGVPTSHMSRG